MPKQGDIERRGDVKSRPASDQTIDRLARRQHSTVARRQLLLRGVTREAIQGRLDRGRMRPIFRGVYVVGPMSPTRLGLLMGATLAVPGGLVSHRNATEFFGLTDPIPGPIHVVSTGCTSRSQPGLLVHRIREMPDGWAGTKDGIPVVAPMLALVQNAAHVGPVATTRMLEQAENRSLLDILVLDEILDAYPNAKHRARLIRAIEPFRPAVAETRSSLEIRFLRAAKARGHSPATNVPIDRYEVDFFWPQAGLIVETDGFEPHRSRSAFDRDRERWARMTSLGFPLVIVTDHRLRTDEDGLFADIEAVLARAGRG